MFTVDARFDEPLFCRMKHLKTEMHTLVRIYIYIYIHNYIYTCIVMNIHPYMFACFNVSNPP